MIHSLINDYLIRVKNAAKAGRTTMVAPSSKLVENVTEVMKRNGFITNYTVDKEVPRTITITIREVNDVKLFSTPGRKLYSKVSELPWGKTKSSLIIVSTSAGIMSQREAVAKNIGGQLIAEIS